MVRLGGLGAAPRVAAASIVMGLAMAAALVVVSGGDVARLVRAAPPNADPAAVASNLSLRPTGEGFDGMFYYRVAAEPLSTAEWAGGIRLDLPALRSSRVLYPALAGTVSLGDEGRLPWALLGVNIVVLGTVGWFGARVAEDLGRRPEWGLLFAAYPGFAYTLARNLTELTEAALVLAGLHFVLRRQRLAAGLALAGAALAKETGIIVPIGLGLAWAWGQFAARWGRTDGGPAVGRPIVHPVLVLVPAAVFAGWHLVVWNRFGASALSANSDNNLRLPLAGFMAASDRFVPPMSGENLFRIVSLGVLALVALAATLSWRRTRADLGIRLAWALAVGMLLLLSEYVYSGATSFMRAGTESYVLGLTMLLGTRDVRVVGLALPVGALTLLTLGVELSKAA